MLQATKKKGALVRSWGGGQNLVLTPPPPVQIKTIVSEQLQLPALLQLSISITIYNNSYVIQDTEIYFILE